MECLETDLLEGDEGGLVDKLLPFVVGDDDDVLAAELEGPASAELEELVDPFNPFEAAGGTD